MKKKNILISTICILLMVLGLVMAGYYYSAYQSYTRYSIYLVFALLGIIEFLSVAFSIYFSLKKLRNGIAVSVYGVAILFSVPVLLIATFWLLHFVGIDFLPPPQR